MATLNDITTLESALTRLDRIVGIGVSRNAEVTATHVRAHTVKGSGNLLAEIAAPLARSATNSLQSDGGGDSGGDSSGGGLGQSANGGGFNLSSGQSMSDLASAISRANKRYL